MTARQRVDRRVDRVHGIESLRALAALAVFYCHISGYWMTPEHHLPGKLPQLLATGAHGVDLFVVISGFCLAMPVMAAGTTLPLRAFYLRRASRLIPPYYVALTFAAAVAMSPMFARTVAARASVGDLVQHVLLLQTWTPSIGTINGSFWSIALEAHLYLLFPVLLVAWRRWGAMPVLATSALLSIGWTSLAALHVATVGSAYVLPARIVEFVAGIYCAQLVGSGRAPRRALLWLGLVVGGAGALAVSTADIQTGTAVVWAVPCSAAVMLVAGSKRLPVLGAAPVVWFGTVSYSFYLVHQPLLLLGRDLAFRITSSPLLQFGLAATVGVAAVALCCLPLHLFVERPSHQLGRRLAKRGLVTPVLA